MQPNMVVKSPRGRPSFGVATANAESHRCGRQGQSLAQTQMFGTYLLSERQWLRVLGNLLNVLLGNQEQWECLSERIMQHHARNNTAPHGADATRTRGRKPKTHPTLERRSRCVFLVFVLLTSQCWVDATTPSSTRRPLVAPPAHDHTPQNIGVAAPVKAIKTPISAVTQSKPTVNLWYRTVPQPARFFLSGRVGDVMFYYLEKVFSRVLTILFATLPESSSWREGWVEWQDSLSFLLGYCVHVVPQHWVHAALVYGLDTINTPQKYWHTLMGMYHAMGASAIGSTSLNTVLLKTCHLDKTLAFILTMGLFSAINYVWIGWVVKRSEHAALAQAS